MNMPDDLTVQVKQYPIADQADLWRSLEEKSEVSIFQTWAWISHWLEASNCQKILVAAVFREQKLIALGVLTANPTARVLGSDRPILLLNANGELTEDRLAVEYNGLVCDPELIETVHYCIARALSESTFADESINNWLEIRFPGCGPEVVAGLARVGSAYRIYRDQSAPFVDLTSFDNGLEPYLATRSANTRHQIRRSMRLLEGHHQTLTFKRATSVTEAMSQFEEMVRLHQARWRSRGYPGAFADEFFTDFHKSFVKKYTETGVADILSLQAENRTIGVLYNFIHDETVYAYQSGFITEQDNRIKPGLVSHSLAVAHYRNLGLRKYCFLAGDDRYKKSLSTGADKLYWVALENPDLQMRVTNVARKVKQVFRNRLMA